VRLPERDRTDLSVIKNLRLPTAAGGVTTLGAVADVYFQAGPAEIDRLDRKRQITTIADTTGGAIFFPDTPQDLDIIFDRIDRELRTQYRLGYYPNPPGPANTYRSIQVKVLDNYKVRHRKTYLTGPK